MMLRTPAGKRPRWAIEAAAPTPGGADEVHRGLSDEEDDQPDGDSMRCSYKCRNMVKSELLDHLDDQETQASGFKAVCEALRTKLSAAEIDNQRLTSKLKLLDQTVAASTAQEQALRAQRSDEIQQGEERFRKQLTRCNELQEKLQAEIRLKSEAEAKARAADAELQSLKHEFKNLQESSAREIQRLQVKIDYMLQDNEYCATTSNIQRLDQKEETENIALELAFARDQLKDLQERLDRVTDEKRLLERELSSTSSQLSTTRFTESQEADAIIKNLNAELKHQSSEIAAAKKIKESHSRLEILQEQLDSERKRAALAEAELEGHADLKLRLSALETEQKAWEDMIAAIPGNLSREKVTETFCDLQREALVGLSENGELKAKIRDLEFALEKAVAETHEALGTVALVRREAEDAQGKLSRLERQVVSLTRERDGLTSILASYDEEEASLLQQRNSASNPAPFATPEKSKQKRIQELEDVIATLQKDVKSLESELEENMEAMKVHAKQSEALSSELATAQSKVSALERQASQLQSEVELLEGKVARGEFDPSKTKVLKLRAGLEVKETCASSTAICKVSEDDTQENIVSIIENKRNIITLTGKIGSLEQEISTLKKRENRYMQVFAEKAFTFRHACGLIFGYEILMNEKPDSAVTCFKLRSVYSRDKENEALEFQYTPNGPSSGRIDMLANDYTTSPEIERQVMTFLQGFKSIPAFVANLTLEQFNKGTIG